MIPHEIISGLESRYNEPHRKYHNLRHIQKSLELLEKTPGLVLGNRDVIMDAIWYHDAIYDPKQHDNEKKSAELADRELALVGYGAFEIARVQSCIMATLHKERPSGFAEMTMVDIDLAILGSDPKEYWEYARAIREEYEHVPNDAYRIGRAGILQQFLDRKPSIYCTEYFQKMFQAQAEINLKSEIVRLS